jgi:SAM-dependent methyltransferase
LVHNPFDRSGLASLDDLSTPLWRSLFSRLESVQSEFLAAAPHGPDYPWPRDPLHSCIRVWEYPFVYHHLQSHSGNLSGHPLPQVVDLGSGATFFPFAVARLGWRVMAVDADSRATSSVDRAIGRMSADGGAVTSLLSDARSVALRAESVDCVYCVSVLEHVPNFEGVVSEVARILRPGGIFVLTFDVDLRGNCELGPAAYERLLNALQANFSPVYPEKAVHPLRVLTTDNSIYPLYASSSTRDRLIEPLRHSLHAAYNRLRGRQLPSGHVLASTYGACLRKLAFPQSDSEVGPAEPGQAPQWNY